MNFIIGLAVAACLLAGEWSVGRNEQVAGCLGLTLLLTVSVPMTALVQSWFILSTRRVDGLSPDALTRAKVAEANRFDRMVIFHTAIWLAAAITITGMLGWPAVVKHTWQLDGWVLVDELLVVAPMLASLVASWAVFFFLEKNPVLAREPVGFILWELFCYLWLRLRMQVLIVVLPIVVVMLIKDCVPWFSGQAYWVGMTAGILFLTGGILFYPLVLRGLLGLHRMPNSAPCLDGLSLPDSVSILKWGTGGRIVNAFVLGNAWWPQIVVSDRLLNDFPRNETQAIIRHEQAHLQRRHSRTRTWFALLPVVVLGIVGWVLEGNPIWTEAAIANWGSPGAIYLLVMLVYIGYLAVTLRWLSYSMELEADLLATCRPTTTEVDHQLANDLSEALLRVAAYCPQQWKQGSWFYPSIRTRVEAIQDLPDNVGQRMSHNDWTRLLVGLLLMMLGVAGLLILSCCFQPA